MEKHLRNLIGIVESTTDLVATANLDGRLSYLNPAGRRLLGWGERENPAGEWIRDAHPDWAYETVVGTGIPAAIRDGVWTGETVVSRRDGREIPVSQVILCHRSPGGEPESVSTIIRDISVFKRAEEALRAREEKLRSVLRAAPTGIGVMTGGVIRETNLRLCEMTGYAEQELLGQNHRMLYATDEGFQRAERGRGAGDSGTGPRTEETLWRRKDGGLIDVLLSSSPLDARDPSAGITFTALDITERKRFYADRRLNESRLSALMELAGMSDEPLHTLTDFALEKAVALTGSTIGYLAFMNETESVLSMYSWSRTAMRECLMEDKPRTYPVESTGLWGEAVRQRRPIVTNDYAAPHPAKKGYPQGHVRVVRHMNIPLFDGNRIVLVSGVGNKAEPYDDTDVRQLTLLMDGMWKIIKRKRAEEERARFEEQLRQAAKMEAVGRLAGGVAHDFNNLLTGILGYAEIVLHALPQDDPIRADAEEIVKAGERASALTRQLLAFSRRQILDPKILDLNELLAGSRRMLTRLIGEDIALVFHPAEGLGGVLADPGQVEQILVNLVVNARDAMPGGGTLTVETGNVRIDAENLHVRVDAQPGPYVLLAVSDTGTGMDEEVKQHLFEPFFTTKEEGRGTGLGLATVYGAVRQADGFVQVYSEPGHGTTFKVFLPLAAGPAEKPARVETVDAEGGTETLLLVEDEDIVRAPARRVLEDRGYRVLEAANGSEALRLAMGHLGPVHLLVTDVVMPRMNGRELYRNLLSIWPGLKVLFISGYSENVIAQHGVLYPETQLLQKPFALEELARRVREILDRTQPAGAPRTFPGPSRG